MNPYFNTIPDDRGEEIRKRVKERHGFDSEKRAAKRARADISAHLSSENRTTFQARKRILGDIGDERDVEVGGSGGALVRKLREVGRLGGWRLRWRLMW